MSPHHPRFSIVVPTYARPQPLAQCLEAMAELDYPRDRFEVVVVDDGSPASPEALVARVRDRIDVKLHRQRSSGPATARNTGASLATGEYLAFTDDDCRPNADWLNALAARFATHPQSAVGGRTENILPSNPYSAASQILIDYLYGYYNRPEDRRTFFASNNIAMPAALFYASGGFDATFPLAAAEDREFCDRWIRLGHDMQYAPEAVVRHAHVLNLRSFVRQHFNYGRGAFHFHKARAKVARDRIRVEPARFYTELLRYPLSRASGSRAVKLSALMGLSQVANVAGFFRERFGSRSLTRSLGS